jgi:hypothetical protein
VSVALQHDGPVGEESGVASGVFVQDDAILHLHEKTGDGKAHPQAAAVAHMGKEALDQGGAVDLVPDYREGSSHLLGFTEALRDGVVAVHIQARGATGRMASIAWPGEGKGAAPEEEEGVYKYENLGNISYIIIAAKIILELFNSSVFKPARLYRRGVPFALAPSCPILRCYITGIMEEVFAIPSCPPRKRTCR